jgi:hypothetical protein
VEHHTKYFLLNGFLLLNPMSGYLYRKKRRLSLKKQPQKILKNYLVKKKLKEFFVKKKMA